MALLGQAALAMWWDMAPAQRAAFEHWHAHEHFPERLGIPGFLRASRWREAGAGEGEGIFVLYELAAHDVLGSPDYLARLNAPSAWSTQMMPHHRHMVRSQCHVLASAGGVLASQLLTLRVSPRDGAADALCAGVQALAGQVAVMPGLSGLHLLRHDAPAIAVTEEQRIRGLADRFADWVLLVSAYDPLALQQLEAGALSDAALLALGSQAGAERARYTLSQAAVPSDVADAAWSGGPPEPVLRTHAAA